MTPKVLRSSTAVAVACSMVSLVSGQSPNIQWQKSFGGTQADIAYAVAATDDGGYLVAGHSASNNLSVSGNHGGIDFWVIRIGANGDSLWQKTYGGSGDERAQSIAKTSDGNFVIVGSSNSNNGDVSGAHGGFDFWVIKIDGDGLLLWQSALGGTMDDEARSVMETSDGGLIVAGWSSSAVAGAHGLQDAWLVKLSSNGTVDSNVAYGGSGNDGFYSVKEVTNGGFIAAGFSESSDGDVALNNGSADCWVLRLDATGTILWERSLGGSGIDRAYHTEETNDGGFVMVGQTFSTNGDVLGNHGSSDAWLFKLSSTGLLQWQNALGGSSNDGFWVVREMMDGDLVCAGWELSPDGGDVQGNQGNYDFWLVRTSSGGDLIWQKPIGGTGVDGCTAFDVTADDGYILVGESYSNNGDATFNRGINDYWIVKLDQGGVGITENGSSVIEVTAMPNPNQGLFSLLFDALPSSGELSVFDSRGAKVYTALLPGQSSGVPVSLSEPGLFLCQLRWGALTKTVRVIVE